MSNKNEWTDPLLEEVLFELRNHETSYIATKSGLCRTTIVNWRSGKVPRPQAPSLNMALRVVGKRLRIGNL